MLNIWYALSLQRKFQMQTEQVKTYFCICYNSKHFHHSRESGNDENAKVQVQDKFS